jgi:hypothetical protein
MDQILFQRGVPIGRENPPDVVVRGQVITSMGVGQGTAVTSYTATTMGPDRGAAAAAGPGRGITATGHGATTVGPG